MRIELNSGGLDGLVSMAEFALSVDALDRKLDDMISSFLEVKKSIRNLEGGVGSLSGAVSSLDRRIFNEQQKKRNLQNFARRFDSFLNMAVRVDNNVANKVSRNKEEFYRVNEHLRPRITIEDFIWDPLKSTYRVITDIGEFLVDTWNEHWDEIVAGTIAVVAVIGGVALIVFTGGTALVIIGGAALIGAGIGLGVTLYKEVKNDGDISFTEGLEGFLLGGAAGAAIGACIYGAAYLAQAIGGTAGGIVAQTLQSAGTNAAMDFFGQTVVEGATIENYSITDTLLAAFKGAAIGATIGTLFGVTGLSDKITGFTKNLIGNNSKLTEKGIKILSNIPKNIAEGAAEGTVDYTVGEITNTNDEETTFWGKVWENTIQNVIFGIIGDSIELKTDVDKPADGPSDVNTDTVDVKTDVSAKQTDIGIDNDPGESMADRIRKNIEESRIARESSNYSEADFNVDGDISPKSTEITDISKSDMADRIRKNIEESRIARESSNYSEANFNVDAGISPKSIEITDISKSEMADRIRKNIEMSRIARESSNFGTGELSYAEHPISSKGLRKLLHNRGLPDDEVDKVMQSFNKYSTSRTMPISQNIPKNVTVKHTPVAGETRWLYSSDGSNASGIFVTKDLYVDNRTGISKLATPATNDMLIGERVIVFNDQINGTVAPQPLFTTDAKIRDYDNVIRIGGGHQTVTNGGISSGSVKRTGEIRRLFDSATRVKLRLKSAE